MNENNKLTRAAVGRIRRLIGWPLAGSTGMVTSPTFESALQTTQSRIAAQTPKDKRQLNKAYKSLHKAGRFDLLAEHAIPYIYLRLKRENRKREFDFPNALSAAMVGILETLDYSSKPPKLKKSDIEAWNPSESAFGTWISNQAWNRARKGPGANAKYTSGFITEYERDLVQGMQRVDADSAAYREDDLRGRRAQARSENEWNEWDETDHDNQYAGTDKDIDFADPEAPLRVAEAIAGEYAADDAWLWAAQFIPDDAPTATEHDLHLYDCLLNDKDLKRGRRRQRIIDLIGDGMDQPAIASLLGKSLRTIQGDYNYIRNYIGRERGSVTDIKEFSRRIRNKRDPAKGAEIYQKREAARSEHQKRAVEALFKPSLSPRGRAVAKVRRLARPVLTADVSSAYKLHVKKTKKTPPWKAAYWAFKRRGVKVTEEQVKTDKFFALPITYREANEIFNHPASEWLTEMLKATPEPVKSFQAPEDMRADPEDPEAAERLIEAFKGWQRSRGGSRRRSKRDRSVS